jgi:hypothetical protein
MPTNRKRTTRGRRGPPIAANDWAYLTDETPENPFTQFSPDAHWRQLWTEHGEQITEQWAAKRPGTRPEHWWKYSAPRLPIEEHGDHADCYFSRDLIQSRRKVKGTGVPAYEVMNVVPHWDLGVPSWMEEVDHDDPPIWETQLAYLKRHGLLLPGEGKKAK